MILTMCLPTLIESDVLRLDAEYKSRIEVRRWSSCAAPRRRSQTMPQSSATTGVLSGPSHQPRGASCDDHQVDFHFASKSV